ncbi:hypothetical protein B7494_g4493 [Chlorociboria aeruginascens]|nr:hypothetical protein B7494_g4493 [Chlorociboria aeruginascens]
MANFADIAKQFTEFYYNQFDTDRKQLGALYRDNSMLTFESTSIGGTAGIVDKLSSLPFSKVKHAVSTFDAQPSNENGGRRRTEANELQPDLSTPPRWRRRSYKPDQATLSLAQSTSTHPTPRIPSLHNKDDNCGGICDEELQYLRTVVSKQLETSHHTKVECYHLTGVICILLCFALGIANLFHIHLLMVHSVSSFLIIFIEIPLLLRICPTSSTFDTFMRRFTTNYMRAAIYLVMAIVQWLSIIVSATSLIAAAVLLTIAAAFYALAGVKGQGFVGSKTLGGQGVAQMII